MRGRDVGWWSSHSVACSVEHAQRVLSAARSCRALVMDVDDSLARISWQAVVALCMLRRAWAIAARYMDEWTSASMFATQPVHYPIKSYS